MKNSVKTIITGAVCAAIAITGIGAGSVLTSAKLAEKKSIGSEAAYSAALNDAGVTSEKASEIKIDFERENGKYVFEVEFDTDDKEYDYFVDAKNGDIISRKVENKSNIEITEKLTQTTVPSTTEKSDNNSVQTTEKATENNISANLLNLEEAKKSVLKDAGLKSSEVTFTKAKLDEDNHYDIEFYTSSKKYEYEISALTGKIIDKETENLKSSSTTTDKTSAESIISVDKAKEIALKKAGLKASDVRFIKAKLEFDDGIQVYQIEFISGSYEYEAEINARNGNIIDFSREIDD